MNPLLRGLLFFLGGLLVLLIFLQIVVSIYADDYVAGKLKERVRSSSDSTYALHFDNLDLNVFTGSATLHDIRLDADTAAFTDSLEGAAPRTLYTGTMNKLEVGGVNLFSSLLGHRLKVNSIVIARPVITVLRNPRALPPDSSTFSSVDSTLYATISDRYSMLEIDHFKINNGRYTTIRAADTLSSLGNLNTHLRNIRVDSSTARSGRLFITDDITLDARKYRTEMSDSLNTLAIGRLHLSSEDQTARVDSIQVLPHYPRYEFSRRVGIKTDRIRLTVPELRLAHINYPLLADSGRFHASFVAINDARFIDFVNQNMSETRTREMLPHIAFRQMAFPVKIDSLKINRAFISYSEYHNKAPQAGTLTFEEIYASFWNISNFPEDVADGITTAVDVQTQVMGSGQFEVHFTFPMDTQNGFHKINGTLGPMSMPAFNPMLKYVAFIKIDSGTLNRMEFDMTLNADRASGNVIMNYENFSISVLDEESIRQEGLLENLKTFLANSLIIRESNTPEGGMEAGRIQYQRVPYKSEFNYWWKSLLTGIKDSFKK